MPHVDEGVLHAYLDGAITDRAARADLESHLAACVACRDALDEARALRERARTILDGASPASAPPPPFEEITARARTRSGRRVLHLSRMRALAWAATVVLALGVGSATTLFLTGDRATPETPPATASAQAGAEAADRARQYRALDRLDDRAAVAPGAVGRAAPSEETRRSEPARPAPSLVPAEQEGAAVAKVAEGAGDRRAAGEEAAIAAREGATPPPAARPTRGLGDSVAPRSVIQLDQVVVTAAPTDSAAAQPSRGAVVRVRGAANRARDSAVESDEAGWLAVGEDVAAAALGGKVARVEGLPVLAYGMRSVDGTTEVRVLQRAESGAVVELIQSRSDGSPPREEVAELERKAQRSDSVATITVRRDAVIIRARANLPAEALRGLLRRIP
jgi:hypothetical protein